MDIPHNPRYIYFNGTYVFRYLLPGQYQVIAEEEGHTSLPVDVSVQNGTSYADIIIQGYDIDSFLSATPSLMTPVSTPAPTALPITPRPTPSAGIPAILLSMAASTSFIQKFRK